MSKLTEFTEELVKSSQKFPSSRDLKKTFFVKLEKDENIAFKLKRFEKEKTVKLKNSKISLKNLEISVRPIKTDQEN